MKQIILTLLLLPSLTFCGGGGSSSGGGTSHENDNQKALHCLTRVPTPTPSGGVEYENTCDFALNVRAVTELNGQPQGRAFELAPNQRINPRPGNENVKFGICLLPFIPERRDDAIDGFICIN